MDAVFRVQVMVHPPETFPDVSIGYKVHAKRDHVYRISVAVAQVKADDSLRRLSRLNDKCFMYNSTAIDEPPYFESNHENTCYSQCRMNTIYKVCNCTQYFFEKYKGECVTTYIYIYRDTPRIRLRRKTA